jgi:hypothetical protein
MSTATARRARDRHERRPGAARLVVNAEHPRGRELAGVLLSTRSLALSQMPRSRSTLFAPTPARETARA